MEKVGKTLSVSLTVPIVAAGAGLLKLANDFEEAENTIRTGTGATGKALEGLNDDFKSVYGQVNQSMSDTSKVVADLNTRTGLAGKPLQALAVQMLQLAKVSKEDLGTLIPATTRMFQDAGIKQADYSKALDYTWKVSQNTGIGVGRLQELMTQFGGPLRQMGFDWKTSATMLGQFEKQGVNTELVVGSLRIALGKMAKQGIADPSKALQVMIEKIKAAGSAGKANAMALSMFGAKAGPDMAAAIREGHMNLSGLLNTLKNSPETVSAAAKATQTFSDKLAILKHQAAVQLEPIGMELLSSLQGMLPVLQNVLNGFDKLIKRFTDMPKSQQEMIIKFAALAAIGGPAIMMLGKITHGVGDMIKPFTELSKSISKAGGIMAYLATPGGIILVVITAIAVAALLLIKYWGPISTFFKKIWADISGPVKKVKEEFQNLIDKAKEIGDKLVDLKNNSVKEIKKIFEDFTQTLKDHETEIKTVATILGVIFAPALIKTGVQAVIAGTKVTASFIASITKTGSAAVMNAPKVIASFVASMIASGTQSVIAGAKIVAGFIASMITSAAQAVITGAAITVSLIGAMIAYVASGWATVAAISAQTATWIAQKVVLLASTVATGAATAAQWLLNAALDANPIGLVIIALAALGLAIYEVVKHWKDICEWVEKAWNWLTKWNRTKAENKNATVTTTMNTVNGPSPQSREVTGKNALGTSYWGGGETWVGENGPERVWLPPATKVADHKTSVNAGRRNISIAKLADTIIVREEADIDKIANALVIKLNAAAVNMT